MDLSQLRDQLRQSFNLSDLADLCMDLGINFESLAGSSIDDKSRELVEYCRRNQSLDGLLARASELRPKVKWPEGDLADEAADTGAIRLTRPLAEVEAMLAGQIERGRSMLAELKRLKFATDGEFYSWSAQNWDLWRQYGEQELRNSFNTTEPLTWLTDLKPRHRDTNLTVEERISELPKDIEHEVDQYIVILSCLPNYE